MHGPHGDVVGADAPQGGRRWPLPPGDTDSEYHVDNLTIEQWFFHARNEYLVTLGVDNIYARSALPVIRELLSRFESEVEFSDEVVVLTNVVSRSRRALVMEQRLMRSGVAVSTCRSVHVFVDQVQGVATEIPAHVWAAIVRREGHDPAG